MRGITIKRNGDPLGPTKTRILRRWSHYKIMIYRDDLGDTRTRLEKDMGVYLGARGLILARSISQMLSDGRVIAFNMDGHVAFLPRSQWLKAIQEDPGLAESQLNPEGAKAIE